MFSLFSVVSFRLTPRALRLTWCALLLTLFLVPSLFAQWEPDVRLTYEFLPSYTSGSSCVMPGPGGMVHVVWGDYRVTATENIYYKRSTDNGVTWGTDTRLGYDPQSNAQWLPSVAVSGSVVHVVWMLGGLGGGPGGQIIYKRSTDSGVTWEAAVRISQTSWVNLPSVAVSDSVVHVVWVKWQQGDWPEILYTRSTDSGASWSSETRLTIAPWDSVRYVFPAPSIAVTGSVVHVVWSDYRSGNDEISYKRSTDRGITWGTDTRLTNDAAYSLRPSVSVSGSFVHVAWDGTYGGDEKIYYKRSTDSGVTWGTDTRLTDAPGVLNDPFVFASGSFVHVVWMSAICNTAYKRSADNGVSWEPDIGFGGRQWPYYYEGYPSVSAEGPSVHVVWTDIRDGNTEIYYKRNPTGNSSVEEETAEIRGHRLEVGLKARPNPFLSFTAIPGHEQERFALYDISGRKVGTYRGDRIGEGLGPGVYFLKPENKNTKPVRIVKVR